MPKHSATIVFTVPAVDGFKVRGVSAKTGRKYRLAEVEFSGDVKFFMSVAEQMIDAVEAAADYIDKANAAAPQSDPKVVDEFEAALTAKLKAAIRDLFGGPIAVGK